MKIKEIKFIDFASLKDEILGMENSEIPLVIRQSTVASSKEEWARFLHSSCHLTHDKRHFNFNADVDMADWAEISNQPEKATSYQHSTTPQPFHTDNAWFSDPAEINVFLMEKQSVKGGEQLIYPLGKLISDLQAEDPQLLADLRNIKVVIKKGDDIYENNTTIIAGSDQPKIFWNYYRTRKDTPEIESLCERFFNYLKSKETSDSVIKVRLEDGDCLVMNDQLMLHARTAFVASAPRERVLLQSMWKLP